MYRGHSGPQEQQELLTKIGMELLTTASDDWETVTYTSWALIGQMSERLEEVRQDGAASRKHAPLGVIDLVKELRAGMYREEKGTWYTISRPGKFKADYDYDNRPGFTFYPEASAFATDLEFFPRSDEHIPDWLREHLDEARRSGEES
ncbi:hypothetical protein ACOALZ_11790 [Nocardiopsis algeriensis]|uniref:hypothetical protein n=1 Tax=Nocardiopsis algeriensis TaxID=1478215 RepID=UPI003B42A470